MPHQNKSGPPDRKKRRIASPATDTAPLEPSSPQGGVVLPHVAHARSFFLELPLELRLNIYAAVGREETAFVPKDILRRRYLLCRCPLGGVSKQIRAEFLRQLVTTVEHIETHVKDFNFLHVIDFFLALREDQLKHMPSVNDPIRLGSRSFHIYLSMTEIHGDFEVHAPHWKHWLSLFGDDEGCTAGLPYGNVFPTYSLRPDPHVTPVWCQTVKKWLNAGMVLNEEFIDTERQFIELRRIVARMERWEEQAESALL